MAACTTALADEARRRHAAWPTATAALGRALTAAALLGLSLDAGAPARSGASLTLRFQGAGPLGGVIAEARPAAGDGDGVDVRGYVVNPAVHLPLRPDGKLDVGTAVGRGLLHVTRDLGLRQPYTGSSELVSGEIGDDLTHHLTHSEQVPSLVALGVLVERDGHVRSAGGLIVQLLPGADPAWADRLEGNVARIGAISAAIDAGRAPEELVRAALDGFQAEVLAEHPLRFRCTCTRPRLEAVLVALGAGELESLLREDGQAELVCHFCARRYRFARPQLERLLERAR